MGTDDVRTASDARDQFQQPTRQGRIIQSTEQRE